MGEKTFMLTFSPAFRSRRFEFIKIRDGPAGSATSESSANKSILFKCYAPIVLQRLTNSVGLSFINILKVRRDHMTFSVKADEESYSRQTFLPADNLCGVKDAVGCPFDCAVADVLEYLQEYEGIAKFMSPLV